MNYVKGYTPLLVFLCAFQQNPRVRIQPDSALVEDQFRINLSGFAARTDVLVRTDGLNGAWHSEKVVHTDVTGGFEIRDGKQLVWSATRTSRPLQAAPIQDWVVSAEVDGKVVASDTIWRRILAPGVRVVQVRERGLVGTAYFPAGSNAKPAVIVLGGSSGGIPEAAAQATGLPSHGYVVLALAYFNAEGLSPNLANVPLEYFSTAVDWLKSQDGVDASRIGVLGTSRGGELALLLGSTFPKLFHVVVAYVPSNVVWPGMSDDSETAAWTLNGQPVRSMRLDFQPSDTAIIGSARFERRMRTQASEKAEIPVEQINAPVLLFSGKSDGVWPSAEFANRVVKRLAAHRFKFPVEHYSYENAGHRLTRPAIPTTPITERQVHPVSKRWNIFGGTPEGQARANEESWARLLTFLNKYLKN